MQSKRLADVHVSHQKACSLVAFFGKDINKRQKKDLHASNHYQTTHTYRITSHGVYQWSSKRSTSSYVSLLLQGPVSTSTPPEEKKRTHDTDPSPGPLDPVANGDDVDTHLLVEKIKRKKREKRNEKILRGKGQGYCHRLVLLRHPCKSAILAHPCFSAPPLRSTLQVTCKISLDDDPNFRAKKTRKTSGKSRREEEKKPSRSIPLRSPLFLNPPCCRIVSCVLALLMIYSDVAVTIIFLRIERRI